MAKGITLPATFVRCAPSEECPFSDRCARLHDTANAHDRLLRFATFGPSVAMLTQGAACPAFVQLTLFSPKKVSDL